MIRCLREKFLEDGEMLEEMIKAILENTDTAEIRIGEWVEEDDEEKTYYAEAYEFDPDGLTKDEQWVELASTYGAESIKEALFEVGKMALADLTKPENPA